MNEKINNLINIDNQLATAIEKHQYIYFSHDELKLDSLIGIIQSWFDFGGDRSKYDLRINIQKIEKTTHETLNSLKNDKTLETIKEVKQITSNICGKIETLINRYDKSRSCYSFCQATISRPKFAWINPLNWGRYLRYSLSFLRVVYKTLTCYRKTQNITATDFSQKFQEYEKHLSENISKENSESNSTTEQKDDSPSSEGDNNTPKDFLEGLVVKKDVSTENSSKKKKFENNGHDNREANKKSEVFSEKKESLEIEKNDFQSPSAPIQHNQIITKKKELSKKVIELKELLLNEENLAKFLCGVAQSDSHNNDVTYWTDRLKLILEEDKSFFNEYLEHLFDFNRRQKNCALNRYMSINFDQETNSYHYRDNDTLDYLQQFKLFDKKIDGIIITDNYVGYKYQFCPIKRRLVLSLIEKIIMSKNEKWIQFLLDNPLVSKSDPDTTLPLWYVKLLIARYQKLTGQSYKPIEGCTNWYIFGALTEKLHCHEKNIYELQEIFTRGEELTKEKYKTLSKSLYLFYGMSPDWRKMPLKLQGTELMNKLILLARQTEWGKKTPFLVPLHPVPFRGIHLCGELINLWTHETIKLVSNLNKKNTETKLSKKSFQRKTIQKIIIAYHVLRRNGEYAVFTHGSNLKTSFFNDIIQILKPKEEVRHEHDKVMRLLFGQENTFSEMLKDRPEDTSLRGDLISMDGNIFNTLINDSAWDLFLHNKSMEDRNSHNFNNFLISLLLKKLTLDESNQKKFKNLISQILEQLKGYNKLSLLPKKERGTHALGRMYLFLIPKAKLKNEHEKYVFSSHSYGYNCYCPGISKNPLKTNKVFTIDKEQKTFHLNLMTTNKKMGKDLVDWKGTIFEKSLMQNECHTNFIEKLEKNQTSLRESHVQYRMGAVEFEKDREKSVLHIDGLEKDFKENIDRLKKELITLFGMILDCLEDQEKIGMLLNDAMTNFEKRFSLNPEL